MLTSPTILTPGADGAIPVVPGLAFTLTNGGLTWTNEGSNNTSGQAFGDNPLSAGSFYWEATLDDFTGSNPYYFGVCSTSGRSSTETVIYDAAGSETIGFYGNSQIVNSGNGTGVDLGASTAGSVIGIAVNIGASLIWFRLNGGAWNNNSSANPATGTGGLSISGFPTPLVPFVVGYEGAVSITFNFGQGQFSSAAPAGFIDWPGAEQISISSISGSIGSPLIISGTTTNAIASALDYSLDGGNTWTACTGYTPSSAWTAQGPMFAGQAFGTIIVRDDVNQQAQSQPQTFLLTAPAPSASYLFTDPFTAGGGAEGMLQRGYNISPGQTDVLQPWANGGVLTMSAPENGSNGPFSYAVNLFNRTSDHLSCQFAYQVCNVNPSATSTLPNATHFGLGTFTNKSQTDPYYVDIEFSRGLGSPRPVENGSGVITIQGWSMSPAVVSLPQSGAMIITADRNTNAGTMRIAVYVNGAVLVDTGWITDSIGRFEEFSFAAGEQAPQAGTVVPYLMTLRNFTIYDTTPPVYHTIPILNCCL